MKSNRKEQISIPEMNTPLANYNSNRLLNMVEFQ